MRFTIKEEQNGRMLRDILPFFGVSAGLLNDLKKKEKGILLNGVRVTVRAVVETGDILDLAIEDEEPNEKIVPTDLPLEIVAETEDFVVANKPPFMPTHPSHGHFTDTLANALVYHYRDAAHPLHPRFVNRLDRNTSGAVLVARHAIAANELSRSMREGKIQKSYVAVVEGETEETFTLTTGIRRVAGSIILREVCLAEEGDISTTVGETLLKSRDFSVVALYPKTGRTHQLRVHMAHLGHPIYGDDLYGAAVRPLGRHALHAATLTFPTVREKEIITVKAPFAADFSALTEALFGKEGAEYVRKRVFGSSC